MPLFKTMVLPVVMCFTLGATTALHAADRMRAGMWENTVTVGGLTSTHSACLSADNAAASNGSSAVIRAAIEKSLKGVCKITDFKLDDNVKNETMICGAVAIRNETKFHGGDSNDTTTTRTIGGVVNMTYLKARRTGDCKAGG